MIEHKGRTRVWRRDRAGKDVDEDDDPHDDWSVGDDEAFDFPSRRGVFVEESLRLREKVLRQSSASQTVAQSPKNCLCFFFLG
jgi:hypothetical protein